jgi:hypothetical protein
MISRTQKHFPSWGISGTWSHRRRGGWRRRWFWPIAGSSRRPSGWDERWSTWRWVATRSTIKGLSALAQVLVAAGRSEEAAALLREAIDRYERKGNVVSAAGARKRLAALIGETDP